MAAKEFSKELLNNNIYFNAALISRSYLQVLNKRGFIVFQNTETLIDIKVLDSTGNTLSNQIQVEYCAALLIV